MRKNIGWKGIVSCLVVLLAIQGQASAQSVGHQGLSLNVRDHQAVGDGKTDDTKAIQQTIDKAVAGDTVYVPEGVFLVVTLRLKSGVHLFSDGLLKQQLASVQEYTQERQASSAPLLMGQSVSDISVSIRTESQHEAIYLKDSKRITIKNSRLKGDSSRLKSFSGIILFNSSDVSINDCSIRYFGTSRRHVKSYQPGTGVRILSSNRVFITGSAIDYNGENGVFMHNSHDVNVENSSLTCNGMSGIQVAFGSAQKEKNFQFINNTIAHNAADAIDVNNRSAKPYLEINCLIRDNVIYSNGFVKGKSTPDGSGIATLINVSGVRVVNNVSRDNNRPAIYLESCGHVYVEGNWSNNHVEIVGELDSLYLLCNEFSNVGLLAGAQARSITLENNRLSNIYLPNGIGIDSLIMSGNDVTNAQLNFNMRGNILLRNNTLASRASGAALWIVSLNSATVEHNTIKSDGAMAIAVRKMANNVSIRNNIIQSAFACISDDGSDNLIVTDNKLMSIEGGDTRYTLVSENPNHLKLQRNKHIGVKSEKTLVFTGEGTASVDNDKIVQGLTDFGQVKVTGEGVDDWQP